MADAAPPNAARRARCWWSAPPCSTATTSRATRSRAMPMSAAPPPRGWPRPRRRWRKWTRFCRSSSARRAWRWHSARPRATSRRRSPRRRRPRRPQSRSACPRNSDRRRHSIGARRVADPARRLLEQGSAQALFARLQGRLGDTQAYYVPVGAMTRLQVGPFDSRASASAACARLKPAALLRRGGPLGFNPVAARDALRPQQGVEAMMVEPGIGRLGEHRLGAIGDAEARPPRSSAGRWRRRRPPAPPPAPVPSSSRASTSAARLASASTMAPAVRPVSRSPSRSRMLARNSSKPSCRGDRRDEIGEAARDQQAVGAVRLHRPHQRRGAGGRPDALRQASADDAKPRGPRAERRARPARRRNRARRASPAR